MEKLPLQDYFFAQCTTFDKIGLSTYCGSATNLMLIIIYNLIGSLLSDGS